MKVSVPLNVLIRKLANFQIEGIFSAGYAMQSHSVVLPVSSKGIASTTYRSSVRATLLLWILVDS
ncbi:hypothetical protein [Barnesiella intestinihominis]|uniref:hypothetical protein n=1 Tax=Barnesiella intestinihominis TaxID=487174 RepID=UPI00266565F0|nr:hypothetical protein [Barnesiella intestinihominis]